MNLLHCRYAQLQRSALGSVTDSLPRIPPTAALERQAVTRFHSLTGHGRTLISIRGAKGEDPANCQEND